MRIRAKSAWLLLAVFICTIIATTAAALTSPPAAKAGIPSIPSPCDLIPDNAARKVCEAATNPLGTAIGAIPGIPSAQEVVGGLAEGIVEPILEQIAKAEIKAVAAALKAQAGFINSTTSVSLTKPWFLGPYGLIYGLAVFLAVALFYSRLAVAIKNSDPAAAGHAGFAILVFMIGGGFIPSLVGWLVHLFDNVMTPGWMAIAGNSTNETLNGLVEKLTDDPSLVSSVGAILLPLLFLFLGLIGGIVLEIMFFFREGMLYIFTAAEVVALALWVGRWWGADMVQRITFSLVGLILFKFIAAFILVIGLTLFGSSDGSPIILGTVTLLMVPIMSVWAYRRISGHYISAQPLLYYGGRIAGKFRS